MRAIGSLLVGFACIAMCAAFPCEQVRAQQQAPPQTPAPSQGSNQDQTQNPGEITAVPNRPTFATTAEAVQRGVLEIEYGFEAADRHQNMNGLLKFGIFQNLELRMANNPFERDAGVAGISDSGAGFKFKVFPQKGPRPTFSILYTASLPTATAELGTDATGHSVQLLLSKDFGKHHFDVNEGVQFVGRQGTSGFDRNYFTALSYSYPITEKWGWTGEIAGFSRTNAATPATMTLLGAATYNLSPRLVLDGGAYVAAYGHLPRVTFFAGATYAIADLYHLHSARSSKKN
jgi:outer membrane putative beta-barrel porin/alpha-amylase